MRTIENAADIIIKNRWFICQCIFLVYIAALAVMDFKYRKLPLKTLLSGLFIAAAGCLCGREISPVLLATGGCMGIVFLLISRVSGESFGYGDSILILIMGIFLGFWEILYLLMGAFSMAAFFSAAMLVKTRFNRKSSFPFVPFLTAAYIGGMLLGGY